MTKTNPTRRTAVRTTALSNIEKLRKLYADDPASLELLDDKETELREAIKTAGLANDAVVQGIIAFAEKEISEIDYDLCTNREITDGERAQMFNIKAVHRLWIKRMSGTQALRTIESIEKFAADRVKA